MIVNFDSIFKWLPVMMLLHLCLKFTYKIPMADEG